METTMATVPATIIRFPATIMVLSRNDTVAITRDAGVLVASTVMLAISRGFALEHVAVGGDAVALAGRDVRVLAIGLGLARGPGEVVAADLDVVVGELAELVVVHAEQFGFFRRAQVQARDEVDGVGDEGGDDEGVGGRGDDVGYLHVHLSVVAVQPAAGDVARVDAVEADDVVGAEEGVEEEADHAADSVFGEDV